jgi:hypothetical protein
MLTEVRSEHLNGRRLLADLEVDVRIVLTRNLSENEV